jgi:hypothetical protein
MYFQNAAERRTGREMTPWLDLPATFYGEGTFVGQGGQSNLKTAASDLRAHFPSTQVPGFHSSLFFHTTRRVSSHCLRIISTHRSILFSFTRINCFPAPLSRLLTQVCEA